MKPFALIWWLYSKKLGITATDIINNVQKAEINPEKNSGHDSTSVEFQLIRLLNSCG